LDFFNQKKNDHTLLLHKIKIVKNQAWRARFRFAYIVLMFSINIIQLLHLNEISMRFYGAEYNNIERGESQVTYIMKEIIF
jgi:cell division protein FtsI/penicillin-binding protein 2